jgi:hypothetical protein
MDQLQELASINEALLSDIYSFSQILLGHSSWHLQTHYFVAMPSTRLYDIKTNLFQIVDVGYLG